MRPGSRGRAASRADASTAATGGMRSGEPRTGAGPRPRSGLPRRLAGHRARGTDVPALARLGFPFADVSADGDVVIGKVLEAGGRVDRQTCTEQLLYEVDDPSGYITPDCVLDMSDISLSEIARDRVRF